MQFYVNSCLQGMCAHMQAHIHALTVARSTSPSREVKSSCRLAGLLLARLSVTCWENQAVQARCVWIETMDNKKGCKHRLYEHMQGDRGTCKTSC